MFLETDVLKAVDALKGAVVVRKHVDETAQGRKREILRYASQHPIPEVGHRNSPSGCSSCKRQCFEVQLRTGLLVLAGQQLVTISEAVKGEITQAKGLHTQETEKELTAESVAELLTALLPEYPKYRQEQYG